MSGGRSRARWFRSVWANTPKASSCCCPYGRLPIGLAAAIDYLSGLDRTAAAAHEEAVLNYAVEKGSQFSGLKRIGQANVVAGVFSFLLEGSHPADVGMLLDQQGVAVRTGHHCAQPLMELYGIPGTVRASFSIYNTKEDVDRLFEALEKVKAMLG